MSATDNTIVSFDSVVHRVARVVLWLEPAVLVVIGLAFFYPTPTRTDWLWLLWLLVPILAARFVLHKRVLTRTPLDGLFLAFLILGAINVVTAPYTRGLTMLARPLYGMALYYAMVEAARTQGNMRGVLQTVIILSLLIGVLAIGSTQWNNKARQLQVIIDALPEIEGFPGAERGFNANEIAGALAWLIPLTGILALHRWRNGDKRWDVTTAFTLMFVALMLGQSRFAIFGVFLALILAVLLIRSLRIWRFVFLGALTALLIFEISLSVDLNRSSGGGAVQTTPTRDVVSLQARLDIWRSSLEIVRDYPFTGVGLSMFRDRRVREAYPAPRYTSPILPHAHNEVLQIGADMGVPGLIVYIGIHVVVSLMLFQIWRAVDAQAWIVGLAAGCGLLAHLLFGLADAITLWDRFAFLFWTVLGLVGALHFWVTNKESKTVYS